MEALEAFLAFVINQQQLAAASPLEQVIIIIVATVRVGIIDLGRFVVAGWHSSTTTKTAATAVGVLLMGTAAD